MTEIAAEYKRDREISFGLSTQWISSFITAHGRNLGVFLPNEMVLIDHIDVDGEHSVIDAVLYKQTNN
jgi:hypothetical protein